MAKALYGHLYQNDARLVWENDRLRARIAKLEDEVERLTLELASSSHVLIDALELEERSISEELRPALA